MGTEENDSTKVGREFVERARAWVEANPDGWHRFRMACAACQRRYGRVSRDLVFTILADQRQDVSDRPGVCRAHDLYSALVRWAVAADPGLNARLVPCSIEEAYPDGMPALA